MTVQSGKCPKCSAEVSDVEYHEFVAPTVQCWRCNLKPTAAHTKPRLRPDDLPLIAELLELLRQASPPFGATTEAREQWKRRRDEVVNQR